MNRSARLIAAFFAVCGTLEARGDFVNGGFESGTAGWTFQYGFYSGGSISSISWSNTPSGHAAPAAVGSVLLGNTIYQPLCGTRMGQINDLSGGYHATRAMQTVTLTAADLGQNACGIVTVSLRYRAVLGSGQGHVASDSARMAIEIRHNSAQAAFSEFVVKTAPLSDWTENPTGPIYLYAHSTYEHTIRNAQVGDTVTLIVSVADCALNQHGGMAWIDCVRLIPVGEGFGSATPWTPQPEPSSGWLVGDFNGDGRDDLLSLSGAVQLSTGSAFAAPTGWSGGFPSWSNAVGDFNSDGRDDVASYFPNLGVFVSLSTGTAFTAAALWHGNLGGTSVRIAAGDFNADGRDDLVAKATVASCGVLLSSGTIFQPVQQWQTFVPASNQGWYAGDFNGDGFDDVGVVTGWGFSVFQSLGSTFGAGFPWTTQSPGFTGKWAVGDFNCDGRCDMARNFPGVQIGWNSSNYYGRVEVLRSNGSTFDAPAPWSDYAYARPTVYVGDFDGSGSADVARWFANGDVATSCSECECMTLTAPVPYCNPLNATERTWPVTIRNMSTLPATSLTVDTGGQFVCTPGAVALVPHLLPGYSRSLQFTLTSITPGNEYCAQFELGGGFNDPPIPLCSRTACFTADDCPCTRFQILDVHCTTDGSGDLLIDFKVLNATGGPIEYIRLDTPVPPLNLTPTFFDIPTLGSGQWSGLLTTRVSAPYSANNLCFRVVLIDAAFEEPCRDTLCVDLQQCPHSWVYCCIPDQGCVIANDPGTCFELGGTTVPNCANCPIVVGDDGSGSPLRVQQAGNAVLTTNPDQDLVVHELGDSGADGFALALVGALDARLDLYPLDPDAVAAEGAFVQFQARGRAGGTPDGNLASLRLVDAGDSYSAESDFTALGSSGRHVLVFAEGVLVGSVVLDPASPLSLSALPGSVRVDRGEPAAGLGAGFSMTFPGGVTAAAGASAYFGDRVDVRAVAGPISVAHFSEMTVTAAGLPSITAAAIARTTVPCPGDITHDLRVDLSDLALLLSLFGGEGEGDLTGDHIVDLSDLSLLLSNYGETCP